MWIEVFIHKEKKGVVDVRSLTKRRGLTYGCLDKDRTLIRGAAGEWTRLFDPLFPGMALELKQDADTAEVRLNFPAGSYDIELFFGIVSDICTECGSESFYIETMELDAEETDTLIDYYQGCSVEILKILNSQLQNTKVTGLIVFTAMYPFVIGKKEAENVGDDIDKYALMINEAQRKKASYSIHWSYLGVERNFCVYEVRAETGNILPLYPVPYLGREMPRNCEYFVDVQGYGFFRYRDFINEFRASSEAFDGASIIVHPDRNKLNRMRREMGVDIASGRQTSLRSRGRFIDWNGYHLGKIIKKGLLTKHIHSYNHIAAYLHWCYENDLISRSFLEEYSDFGAVIEDESIDLRIYLKYRVANGGAVGPGMFTAEGERFARYYYVFGEDGYPADVDAVSQQILGDDYNSPEMKDEGYLFVPYSEEYRSLIFERIDAAWKRFKAAERDPDMKLSDERQTIF